MGDLLDGVRSCVRHGLRSTRIAASVGALLAAHPVHAVVIDFSTFFGGSGKDLAADVALDGAGNVYLLGVSGSTNFPGLDPKALPNGGRGQTYLAKFDPNGRSLFYVTAVGTPVANPPADPTLGLANGDRVLAMAVDGGGSAYVAAYESAGAGGRLPGRRYLYKLDPSGHLQWAFLLDPAIVSVRAVAVDAGGSAYLTGNALPGLATTAGAVYPATNRTAPFLTAYLLKVDPAGGSTVYLTYLTRAGQRPFSTPSQYDRPVFDWNSTPYALAVDAAGSAYVTGQATDDFGATTAAVNRGSTTHAHTFVARVNATGSALLYVARMGGSNSDRGTGIAVASDGSAVVSGKALMAGTTFGGTLTVDFPVVLGPSGIFQSGVTCVGVTCSQSPDPHHGFLFKLAPDGRLVFSGLVSSGGGTLWAFSSDVEETPVRLRLDGTGAIWAAGTTLPERALPTQNPVFPGLSAGAFVLETDANGAGLRFATSLGAGATCGLAPDAFGNVLIGGSVSSPSFPLVASFQGSLGRPPASAATNAFLTMLSVVSLPLTLAADVNPAPSGSPLRLTATVGGARDLGSVEFREGTTLLGTSSLAGGIATLDVSLPAGIHPLTAVYHGPGLFEGSESPVVFEIVNPSCN